MYNMIFRFSQSLYSLLSLNKLHIVACKLHHPQTQWNQLPRIYLYIFLLDSLMVFTFSVVISVDGIVCLKITVEYNKLYIRRWISISGPRWFRFLSKISYLHPLTKPSSIWRVDVIWMQRKKYTYTERTVFFLFWLTYVNCKVNSSLMLLVIIQNNRNNWHLNKKKSKSELYCQMLLRIKIEEILM